MELQVHWWRVQPFKSYASYALGFRVWVVGSGSGVRVMAATYSDRWFNIRYFAEAWVASERGSSCIVALNLNPKP